MIARPKPTQGLRGRSSSGREACGTSGTAPKPSRATSCWPRFVSRQFVRTPVGALSLRRAPRNKTDMPAGLLDSENRSGGFGYPQVASFSSEPGKSLPSAGVVREKTGQKARYSRDDTHQNKATCYAARGRSRYALRKSGIYGLRLVAVADLLCATAACSAPSKTYGGCANPAGRGRTECTLAEGRPSISSETAR
jgi:hypothetical protein